MTIVATGNSRDSFSAPMMVTVIKGDTPTSHSAFSAIDMLRAIPGITLSGSGRTNGQEISMRGYDSKGVLTLVDGVRQGIETVHTSSIFLDPSMIKQAEIVRGPSALLYGGSALGGWFRIKPLMQWIYSCPIKTWVIGCLVSELLVVTV